MPQFKQNDISIHYEVHGEGQPVVLIHGGAVSFEYNYGQFGWVEYLVDRGFQVVGLDLRGHGQSDKPVGSEYYGTKVLSSDVIGLLEYLELKMVSIIGYSLGTAISLELLHKYPNRLSCAALIATGDGLLGHSPHVFNDILPGLGQLFSLPDFPSHLPNHISAYWKFFRETGLELESMTSFSQADYPHLPENEVSTIQTPTLVVSGEKDLVLGKGQRLAKALVNGKYSEIAGADHFSLVADMGVRQTVGDFLTKS